MIKVSQIFQHFLHTQIQSLSRKKKTITAQHTTPQLSSDWPVHQLHIQPAPEDSSFTAHTETRRSCSRLFLLPGMVCSHELLTSFVPHRGKKYRPTYFQAMFFSLQGLEVASCGGGYSVKPFITKKKIPRIMN
ncbi:hypothetical protein AVEN_166349-1 [Araneus ventricosus]|uniref:Uncharacterized protein n=1 Tax=Araneus ventricosus TaxID=182803 RepID=A0A4Y2TAM9_ARAVE|nr:hypothetical protein AVEN_166349-1 [Araneus ventricosus]